VITSQRVSGHPARGDLRLLKVRLSSRLWVLSQRKNSRVYQNASVITIATQAFRSVGVQVEARLDTRLRSIEYCVQYRESELDFVTRILAEHGVGFALRAHTEAAFGLDDDPTRADLADVTLFGAGVGDSDTAQRVGEERVVLFDHSTAWREPPVPLTFVGAVEDRGGIANGVTDFEQRTRIRPTRVSTRSYDARQPSAELVSHADARSQQPGAVDVLGVEIFDHRDAYLEPLSERSRARVILEGERARAEECEGRATTPSLEPGVRFHLDAHREAVFNREYLVTAVQHEGHVAALLSEDQSEVTTYACRFRCVDSDVNPRPRRRPRPVVQVTETAVVVGHEEGVCAMRMGVSWVVRTHKSTATSTYVFAEVRSTKYTVM
jgi:type VI secretion system secreted protein VgrG